MKSFDPPSKTAANQGSAVQRAAQPTKDLVNNRPQAIAQRKLQAHINSRPRQVAQRQQAPVIQMVSMETVTEVAQYFGVTVVESTPLSVAIDLISTATGLPNIVTYGIITVGITLGARALIGRLLNQQNTVTIHINPEEEAAKKKQEEEEAKKKEEEEAKKKKEEEAKKKEEEAKKKKEEEAKKKKEEEAKKKEEEAKKKKEEEAKKKEEEEAKKKKEEEEADKGEWAVVDRSRAPRVALTKEERYQHRLDQAIGEIDRELIRAMSFPTVNGVKIGPRYDVDADLRQDVYDHFSAKHNKLYAGYYLYIVRGNKNPPQYYNISLHSKLNQDTSTTMANLHINN